MQSLIDFLKTMFMAITSYVWDAIVRFYYFVQDSMNEGMMWLMGRLADILPDTAQNIPSVLTDYFGVANYYFPVSEMFTLIAIYIQFRLALFIVRGTVKLMTAGQV